MFQKFKFLLPATPKKYMYKEDIGFSFLLLIVNMFWFIFEEGFSASGQVHTFEK